ncbi:MAG: carboxypeptidase-like regulatory domain-containing protein [Planctomycetota bacterium]
MALLALGVVLAWVILGGREPNGAGGGGTGEVAHIDPGRLEGLVVRDDDGEPVQGAKVELRFKDGEEFDELDSLNDVPPRTLAETRTDEEGAFAFDVEPGLLYRLRAIKEGNAPRTAALVTGGARAVLRMSPPVSVSGIVRRRKTKEPVEGATITVQLRGDPTNLAETSTGPDGRYRLTGMPPEDLRVECRVGGSPSTSRWIGSTHARSLRADFELDDGLPLFGQVTDALTGRPIPNASVSKRGQSTPTDGDGHYRMFVGWELGWVIVRATGFVTEAVKGPRRAGRLDIELRRGGGVRGRLVDTEGNGIRKGQVMIRSWQGGLSVVEADQDGRFRSDGYNPRMIHLLYLRGKGAAARIFKPDMPVEVDEGLDLGDLELQPAGTILGRVVDEKGIPYSKLEVRIEGPLGTEQKSSESEEGANREVSDPKDWSGDYRAQPFLHRRYVTAADGSFRATGLCAGTYEIRVSEDVYELFAPSSMVQSRIQAGQTVQDLDVVLERSGIFTGKVVMSDGSRLPALSDFQLIIYYRDVGDHAGYYRMVSSAYSTCH